MQTTSPTLLQRLANGADDESWTRFIEIYKPLILAVIRTFPSMTDQAEDITQAVLLVLVKDLPSFHRQRPGSFRTWLRRIVVHKLHEFHRKGQRFPKPAAGSDVVESRIAELADPSSELSQQWDKEHDRHVVNSLMEMVRKDFSESNWTAFRMLKIDGRPVGDIARELNKSENAVYLASSRILKRLRDIGAGLIDT
ncbi:MAG: sigma-70 family RNA polymerase sigma factor [Planctomycetales bacterium]|nr:sigma-70 family RNA polymerase sigma factor [Planctomycetales bacterium]